MSEAEQSDLSKAFISEATKYLFEVFKGAIDPSKWRKSFDEKRLRKACEDYASSYDDAYGKVKVLGMSSPVSLHRIYTNVECNNPSFNKAFESLQNLEDRYRSEGQRNFFFGRGERYSGLKVANDSQYLNVLGDPGAGKTTFLKRVGLEALKPVNQRRKEGLKRSRREKPERIPEFEHERIPVFIEFRRLEKSNYLLMGQLQEAFNRFDLADEGVEAALDQGMFLFLLDGLDEVKEEILRDVVADVSDFCNRYPKNRFITSCRTAYYRTYFKQFHDVVLAHFDDEQIVNFLGNWFHTQQDIERKTKDILFRKLQLKCNLPILELARTPLLLTFICIVFSRSQSLPKNRSTLYQRALLILMDEWASEKLVHQDRALEELQGDFELLLLGQVAADAFIKDKIFFSERELLEAFDQFFNSQRNISDNVKASKVLRAIEVRQGLLVKRAEDAYSFSHLTIQEYLVAKHLSDRPSKQEILRHVKERRWREVFRLMVGIRASSKFLDLMCDQAARELSEFGIGRDLVIWCKELSASGKYGEDCGKNRARIFCNGLLDIFNEVAAHCRRDPNLKNTLAAVTIGRAFTESLMIFGSLAYGKVPRKMQRLIKVREDLLTDIRDYERALPEDVRTRISESDSSILEDLDDDEFYLEELDEAFFSNTERISKEEFEVAEQAFRDMREEFKDSFNEQDRALDHVGWSYGVDFDSILIGSDKIEFREDDGVDTSLQWVDFTENSTPLLDYLYIQVLICECGQTSIDLTNIEWRAIEARILA